MDMLLQEYAGMPVIGWVVLGAFAIFIVSRFVKSNRRKRSGGSGGGGGGGTGRETHHK